MSAPSINRVIDNYGRWYEKTGVTPNFIIQQRDDRTKANMISKAAVTAVACLTLSHVAGNYCPPIYSDRSFAGLNNQVSDYTSSAKNQRSATMPRNLKAENLERLDSFAALPNNWNGNGAAPISPNLINKMKFIVERLVRQPSIYPTACDSIQFEYEKKSGEYLEFQLFEDDTLSIFRIDAQQIESTQSIKLDIDQMNKVVNDFYG